jgi:hypothetical protein
LGSEKWEARWEEHSSTPYAIHHMLALGLCNIPHNESFHPRRYIAFEHHRPHGANPHQASMLELMNHTNMFSCALLLQTSGDAQPKSAYKILSFYPHAFHKLMGASNVCFGGKVEAVSICWLKGSKL